MRARFQKYGIWILIALLLVGGGYFWLSNRPAKASPYQTVRVERGDLSVLVSGDGTVESRQSATLFWQVSGVVEAVNVKIGDKVQKGHVLATLEKSSLPQNVLLAEADLQDAQRQLEELLHSNTPAVQAWIALQEAQDAYDKAKRYYDSLFQPYEYDILQWRTVTFTIPGPVPQTITRTVPMLKTVKIKEADEETKADAKADLDLKAAQLEDARRAYERLKDGPDVVQLTSLQARIAAAQATLDLARITAPFEGTITQVEILPGDPVTPGSLAFRLDDLSHLYVRVNLSELDINAVHEGQEVTIKLDGVPGREYHGAVVETSRVGVTVGNTIYFPIKVEFTDADEQVRVGMSATVDVLVRQISDVLLVPNRAVRLVDGKYTVYVLKQDQVEPLEIRLGPSGGTMSVLLSENLREGDLLVLNPPLAPQPGQGPPPFIRRGR